MPSWPNENDWEKSRKNRGCVGEGHEPREVRDTLAITGRSLTGARN